MFFWVPAFAGMTGRGLRVGGYLVSEYGYFHAGTPYGVRGWGRLCPGVAARWPYPALRRFNRSAIGTGDKHTRALPQQSVQPSLRDKEQARRHISHQLSFAPNPS